MKQKLFKSWLLMMCLLFGVGTSWAADATFTFGEQGYNNAQQVSSGTIDSYTSWSATDGTNATAYYNTGTGLRIYNGGTFTVTSTKTIASITLTFSATGYTFSTSNTTTPQTVTPNATSYSWNVSRTCRLQKVEITYASGSTTTYNVTVANDIANGKVTASSTSAAAGATVTLTATPDDGYEFGSWNVKNASTSKAITVTDNKFTMPAANVNVSATFNKIQGGGGDDTPTGSLVYKKVTSQNDIVEGGVYLIVCENQNTAMGSQNSNRRNNADVTISNNSIVLNSVNDDNAPYEVTLAKDGDIYKMVLSNGNFLGNGAENNNYLKEVKIYGDGYGWTLTYDTTDKTVTMKTNHSKKERYLCVNTANTDSYATYTSIGSYAKVTLYKKESSSPAPTLSSIAVKTAPTKTTYTEGEKFDPTGLVITKTMSDDNTEDIAYAGNEASFSFDPSLETALATTDTKVTITYGEKTCEQAITVKEAAKYTVKFNAQAGTCETTSLKETAFGAGVTLPTATCLNSEWTFAGWATAACEETTTAPTLYKAGENYKPAADITLYAVYMTGAEEGEIAFNRVTALSQIKNGDKVVVVHNSTNYAMTLSAGDNATVENVNTISMSAVKKIWTVAITEDIYTFTDNQSTPKTLSTSGVPRTSTENIASVGAKGSSNNSYKYADWNISASSIKNCWVLTNTYTTDNGSAALTVNSNPQWGVLNVNNSDGPRDASVFAMRIYVEGPTTNATYNSNPVETGIISIRTPEGYATYSDTRNFIVPEGLTVSVVALGENNKLEITNYSTDDVVEAGTGVLVYGTTGDHKIVYTDNAPSMPLGHNDLHANQSESDALAKNLVVANYYYVLCYDMNDKNLGFYWFNENGDGEFYVPAQKVILALPKTISAKAAYVLSEDSATGISAIENKVNGDAVYNLAGQRVATKGYKGIVIKNGKKILVK